MFLDEVLDAIYPFNYDGALPRIERPWARRTIPTAFTGLPSGLLTEIFHDELAEESGVKELVSKLGIPPKVAGLPADALAEEGGLKLRKYISSAIDYSQKLRRAVRYLLDVDTVSKIAALKLAERPRFPFHSLWVEFNGALEYKAPQDYFLFHEEPEGFSPVPLLRGELAIRGIWFDDHDAQEGKQGMSMTFFPRDQRPPIGTTGPPIVGFHIRDWPKITSSIPRTIEEAKGWISDPKAWDRFESRLLRMDANVIYFLNSENQLKLRIRPEHHDRHGRKMNPLPKSPVPYYIIYFQAPCYKYAEPGGRTPASPHAHRVRGHYRRLLNQRFTRDAAGDIRRIWIDQHIRGLGRLTEALRVGRIPGSILDYDRFAEICESSSKPQPGHCKKV